MRKTTDQGLEAIGVYRVGNRLFAVCPECRKLVRIDKPIFGSRHFCTPATEER